MKKLIDLVSEIVKEAFVKCEYDEKYGMVTLSNRPDLSEFQCNGALGAAKVYKSEGALIVDVKEDSDTKEIPPCILVKSNGATLYSTTDLATIVERMKRW